MSSIIENDERKNHELHFDNFFTSYSLKVDLTGRNLRAIGTVRSNVTESCFFGVTKKDERASYDYKSDGMVFFFSGKIIPLLQLVIILAKSHQWMKSQDG